MPTFEKMLCIEPKNARAHRLQTLARRYSEGDPHIGVLEGMYAEVEPKSHDKLLLEASPLVRYMRILDFFKIIRLFARSEEDTVVEG